MPWYGLLHSIHWNTSNSLQPTPRSSWIQLRHSVLQDTQPSEFKGNVKKPCPCPYRTALSILDLLRVTCHQDFSWVACNSVCVEGHLPPLSQGYSVSKISLHEIPQDHTGLGVTVTYSHRTLCWQENLTVLASPSQSRCWQSAEPGGDPKETTFLPLLRNPERY